MICFWNDAIEQILLGFLVCITVHFPGLLLLMRPDDGDLCFLDAELEQDASSIGEDCGVTMSC